MTVGTALNQFKSEKKALFADSKAEQNEKGRCICISYPSKWGLSYKALTKTSLVLAMKL